jgi:hypothetical protein
VDRLHDYGTPFFIEANLPIESAKHASAFQRLMIAQDTGSAIIDSKPPASPSAPRSVAVSKQVKQVEYQSAGITLPSYGRNSRQADNSTVHNKQIRLNSPSRGRTPTEVEVRKHNGKGNVDLANSRVDPRVAASYARGATGARIDSKPPASPSAPRSVAVSKQVKQVKYQSTGITLPSYGRNSRQADNSTVHNKQIRLNSPSRGRTPTQNWVR